MNDGKQHEQWTKVIEPPKGWFALDLKEIWSYKYLMYLLVKRDFIAAYKQTILGPLWFILQPLMTTGIYSIIFSGVAKIPTDQVPPPLFYLTGTTIWGLFSTILSSNSSVLVSNAGLFGKIFFPRLIVPLSASVSKFYQLGVQLLLLLIVWVFYLLSGAYVNPTLWLMALPLIMMQLGVLALGFGLWVSAWTVKYRDLGQLVGFGLSLWMWATPIIYPFSLIDKEWLRAIIWLNPVASSVELFRLGLTGAGTFDLLWVLYSWIWSIGIFLVGLALFHRAEHTYIDVV